MSESTLEDVIARTDTHVSGDADEAPTLSLHIARPIAGDVDWQCSHQIMGLDGEDRIMTAYGVDSFQALCLCIRMARARLLDIEHRHGIRLLDWDSEDADPA